MRTTLDLPEDLIEEAIKVTHKRTKTEVIIFALESLVRNAKLAKIKSYKGKINLEIDLDGLRQR